MRYFPEGKRTFPQKMSYFPEEKSSSPQRVSSLPEEKSTFSQDMSYLLADLGSMSEDAHEDDQEKRKNQEITRVPFERSSLFFNLQLEYST